MGQKASAELYSTLLNQSWTKKYIRQFTLQSYQSQYGQKVHDCSGLIKGYLMCDSADAFFNSKNYDPVIDGGITYEKCTEKGTIDTMPEVPGTLVFMPGHVGVYIGSGQVIEARGHAYGVVQTALKDRPWTTWGKCKFINYVEEKKMTKEEMIKVIKEKAGVDDNTIKYLEFYRYGDALIEKLAKAMK